MTVRLPALPANWAQSRVDRVATVNARIGWKALTADEYQPEGYAFLATPNIKNRDIDYQNVNYITEERYKESPELQLQPNDVLLSKDGTLGVINIVQSLPRPATVNSSIAVIRPFNVNPTFLRYTLESKQTQAAICMLKGGMGIPHLFQWDINRLPLPMPPVDEQRRIADFLDIETTRIDRLISLRKRQLTVALERLTAAAMELTRRNNILGRGEVSEDLFIQLRRSISSIQTGFTPDGLQAQETMESLPWYTPAAIGEMLNISTAGKFIEEGRKNVPIFPEGSILVTGIGESLGKVGYLKHRATGNQQLTALVPADDVDGRFIAWQLWASSPELRDWAQYSRIRILNNEKLKEFPIYLPSHSEQVSIAARLDKQLKVTVNLQRKMLSFHSVMSERRQALITAAVTGQFDVSSASGRGAEA